MLYGTVSKNFHCIMSKPCRNFCTVLCQKRVAIFAPCYVRTVSQFFHRVISKSCFQRTSSIIRGLNVQLYFCLNKRQHLFYQNHFHIFGNYKSTIKFEIRYFGQFSSSIVLRIKSISVVISLWSLCIFIVYARRSFDNRIRLKRKFFQIVI